MGLGAGASRKKRISVIDPIWTPKACRRIALYGFLGHYFTYFGGGLGSSFLPRAATTRWLLWESISFAVLDSRQHMAGKL